MNLLQKLSRLNIIKVTIAYLMVAWILLHLFKKILPPNWIIIILALLITIGFLMWLIFCLSYQFTPEEIKRIFKVQKKKSISDKTNDRSDILIELIIAIIFSFINNSVLNLIFKYTPDLLIDKSIIVLPIDVMYNESDSHGL